MGYHVPNTAIECVLLLQNVFSYYRMCSLTIECRWATMFLILLSLPISLSHSLSFSLSLSLFLSHYLSHSLSFSLSLTLFLSHSLSFSRTHSRSLARSFPLPFSHRPIRQESQRADRVSWWALNSEVREHSTLHMCLVVHIQYVERCVLACTTHSIVREHILQ